MIGPNREATVIVFFLSGYTVSFKLPFKDLLYCYDPRQGKLLKAASTYYRDSYWSQCREKVTAECLALSGTSVLFPSRF